MAETKDGRWRNVDYYTQRLYYNTPRKHWFWSGWPLTEMAVTNEVDGDYRQGRGVVFRIPMRREAFLFGIWGKQSRTEEESLVAALHLKVLPVDRREIHGPDTLTEDTEDGVLETTEYHINGYDTPITSYRYDPDPRPAELGGAVHDERLSLAG